MAKLSKSAFGLTAFLFLFFPIICLISAEPIDDVRRDINSFKNKVSQLWVSANESMDLKKSNKPTAEWRLSIQKIRSDELRLIQEARELQTTIISLSKDASQENSLVVLSATRLLAQAMDHLNRTIIEFRSFYNLPENNDDRLIQQMVSAFSIEAVDQRLSEWTLLNFAQNVAAKRSPLIPHEVPVEIRKQLPLYIREKTIKLSEEIERLQSKETKSQNEGKQLELLKNQLQLNQKMMMAWSFECQGLHDKITQEFGNAIARLLDFKQDQQSSLPNQTPTTLPAERLNSVGNDLATEALKALDQFIAPRTRCDSEPCP